MPYRLILIACVSLAMVWPQPAEAQRTRPAGTITGVQVRLLNGKTIALSPPFWFQGRLRSSRLSIDGLSLWAVDKITAAGPAGRSRRFTIQLRDGTTIGGLVPDQRSLIRGRGSWGTERIPLTRVTSIVVSHAGSFAKTNQKPAWRATLADGTTLPIVATRSSIRPVIHGNFGRALMGLHADRVKQLTFHGGLAKVVGYDGRVLAEGWRPQGPTIASRTWYGLVRFNWSQIRALESLIVAPPTRPKSLYKITLADGRSALLHGVRIGGFSAWVKDVLISFQRGPISHMTRSPDGKSAELTMLDGRKLPATDFRNYSGFSVSSDDGYLSGSWTLITKIERIGEEKAPVPEFEPQWQLVTRQGLTLPVRSVRVYKGTLQRRPHIVANRSRVPNTGSAKRRGPVKSTLPARRGTPDVVVRRLNWAAVGMVKADPDGLRVIFTDDSWIALKGAITAQSAYGRVSVPAKSVAGLTKIEGAHPRPSTAFHGPVVGTLKIEDGREFKVQRMSFEGGRRVHSDRRLWGYRMLITRVPPVELWSPIEALLQRGISHDPTGHVLGKPFAGAAAVPLTGVRGVRVTGAGGEFFVPAALIGGYRPKAKAAPLGQRPARFRLRVFGASEKSAPFEVSALTYARYPRRGYSGVYTRANYPFQWHRSRTLYFRRDDTGSELSIDLGRLKRIELIGRYVHGRRATVTNREGDTISGSIHPGAKGRGRGVSQWDAFREGLLGRLADGSYIFVRFANVTRVELEPLDAKP